jgi:5-methylcytosine-specific restriction endonuclease McrA
MTKPKYTPEERKLVMAENLKRNRERAEAKGYTQKSAAREKAIENGEKTYIGSTACKHCGSYEKYVSNWACSPCAIKKGLEKLNNEELMKPYRTKEKKQKYCENNKEKVSQIKRKYAKSERGKAVSCEKQRRRYARLKQGIPIEITEQQLREIQKIYQEAQNLTFITGVQYDVDHIIPLFEGGMHHPDNLQIIAHNEHIMKTAQENSRRQQK